MFGENGYSAYCPPKKHVDFSIFFIVQYTSAMYFRNLIPKSVTNTPIIFVLFGYLAIDDGLPLLQFPQHAKQATLSLIFFFCSYSIATGCWLYRQVRRCVDLELPGMFPLFVVVVYSLFRLQEANLLWFCLKRTWRL